jgi:hypothetical protein
VWTPDNRCMVKGKILLIEMLVESDNNYYEHVQVDLFFSPLEDIQT